MLAIAFKTKKEAKAAVPFGSEKVIETSMMGREFRDGKQAVVISTQPDRVRNVFGSITVKDCKVIRVD